MTFDVLALLERWRACRSGTVGSVPTPSVSFLGVHTRQLEPMKWLYRDAYRLPMLHEAPGMAWFALAEHAELHVYGYADDDHRFFGAGPVPGLLVDDFAGTVARLDAAGVEWLTEPDVRDGRTWRHYRAPDGNVYEVMGPAR